MNQKLLSDLVSDLEQELLRLGYTEGSMCFYRRRWRQLIHYAEEHNEKYFTEQLGIAFLKDKFDIAQDDFTKVLPQKETQELRVIRMIGDFQIHHAVLRRYMKHKEILTDPIFVETSEKFKNFCIKKGYSKVTIGHYVKQSAYMMDYLSANEISDFNDVTIDIIFAYIRTLRCHMLRHSKAVHLLQAGVNLIYIRDFLGHSDIKTTEIYARADSELKRKALENAYPDLVDTDLPDWNENTDLMNWLSKL